MVGNGTPLTRCLVPLPTISPISEQNPMNAKILQIQNKFRYPVVPASIEDFQVIEGEAIDPQTILRQPNVSLYCLDDANQRAIFVETTPGVELAHEPFFYQAQFDQAQRLIAVPYPLLPALARTLPDRGANLTILYTVGRSGSTLLSHAFGAAEATLSLSEPDVFCDIALLREADGSRDQVVRDLLYSSTQLLCKPSPTIDPLRYVIKPRPQALHYAEVMHALFPQARLVFLYRNAVDFICSFARFRDELRNTVPELEANLAYYSKVVPLIQAYADIINFADPVMDFYIIWWLSCLDSYLRLHRQGIPFFALRYEELKSQPQAALHALFAYCGLPQDAVDKGLRTFAKDSQANSALSQEKQRQLAPAEVTELQARVATFLSRHPEIKRADFSVPGTFAQPAPFPA